MAKLRRPIPRRLHLPARRRRIGRTRVRWQISFLRWHKRLKRGVGAPKPRFLKRGKVRPVAAVRALLRARNVTQGLPPECPF